MPNTLDRFIVLTPNVFAILGLRAMYFLLAGMHERFHLLSYGLAIVLILIGGKMLLIDVYKIPVAWSLLATAAVLGTTMVMSLYIPPRGYTGSAYPFSRKAEGKRDKRADGQALRFIRGEHIDAHELTDGCYRPKADARSYFLSMYIDYLAPRSARPLR